MPRMPMLGLTTTGKPMRSTKARALSKSPLRNVRPCGVGAPASSRDSRVASLWVHTEMATALESELRLHLNPTLGFTPSETTKADLEYRVVDNPRARARFSRRYPLVPLAPRGRTSSTCSYSAGGWPSLVGAGSGGD